jgi:shikimate dehydrogenase
MSNGSTIQCGIVLHPAGHTRSPAMHRAAYRALGIDADYKAYDVPPTELKAAVRRFRNEGLRQLSVSLPHKEVMLSLVDEVDPVARKIGAINTVTLVADRWVGTNTDWLGALQALERRGAVDGGRAVVLGAGGTARALVYGLCRRGCEVFVLNRTRSRAESLVEDLGAAAAGDLNELAALAPDIIVNTTTVGLNEMESPVTAAAIPKSAVVMDAVYAPERTQFLLDAETRGAQVVGGKWMLVYQAAEQLRLWTAQLENPPSEEEFGKVTGVMAEAFG